MHTHHGAGFDHPEQYDRSAGRVTRRLHTRIAHDVAALGLPPGATVVDVGTGPGRLAAAIAAAARPGEVLVSRTVRDIVAGSGIAFEERREDGVDSRLFAAVAPAPTTALRQ